MTIELVLELSCNKSHELEPNIIVLSRINDFHWY